MLWFCAMHGKVRRRLFVAITVALLFFVAEGVGRLGYWLMTGEGYDRSAVQQRRREVLGMEPQPLAEAVADQGRSRALHPFLGSVLDPGAAEPLYFDRYRALPDPNGFYAVEEGEAPAEGHTVVGIFGGSVATAASFAARESLARRLKALLGRPVAFRSRALGGFKQPQQLLALTYSLSLGERYDVVINLDGFNEVALPMLLNRLDDVYPFYPRDWRSQVAGIDDPARRLQLGSLALEEATRKGRAAGFEIRLLRAFAPWNLLWQALDRRAERRIGVLQETLAMGPSAGRSYRDNGPPWDYSNHRQAVQVLVTQWAAASLQMHRLCEANGIRYLHFLQPNQYVPGSKRLHPAEERIGVTSRPRYGRFVAMGWPYLQEQGEALRHQGVDFVDLTMLFADVEAPIYRDDCCHINERGHRILGEALADGVAAAFGDGRPQAPSP